jgi:hypothetical protein
MKINRRSVIAFLAGVLTGVTSLSAQTVPAGINYQAVARDNTGKELANTSINVKFSILKDSPLGSAVYEELHSNVVTSKYGVFSLVIGHGTVTGGTAATLNAIDWSTGTYYLNVAVKFDNSYLDMGTMQFMAVPYALYAAKSLEPGPQGPKGDQGDPATDNQTLSFDGSTLAIAGGNVVDLSGLLQNLTITNAADGNYIGISRGNSIKVSTIEGDGDPTNEIQDLVINDNVLKITRNATATGWDLSKYLDNTDSQSLTYNTTSNVLGISGSTPTVDLSALKQSLAYNESTKSLTLSNGNSVTLGTTVAFKTQKLISTTAAAATDVTFIGTSTSYNDGNGYNTTTGEFTAPVSGIYTFTMSYNADGTGGSRELKLFINSSLYDYFAVEIASASIVPVKSITLKLVTGDVVKAVIFTGVSTQTGSGTFCGFRIN